MANDKVQELAKVLGCKPEQVQSMINSINYRKEYAQRPDVKEKRKNYAKERNARMSLLRELLKDDKS